MKDRFSEVEQLLREKGIRLTDERRIVIRRAVSYLHFTAEELVKDIKLREASIARGTVYRTLSLLQDLGVVEKHDFRYGPPNYEVTFAKAHHDHLMCVQCGEIIEFQEPRIETLQNKVVERYKYHLISHTHKLYGLCEKCRHVDPRRAPKRPRLHVEEVVA
jgi:Fur family transcriptional regulator, ferric uptake regulator